MSASLQPWGDPQGMRPSIGRSWGPVGYIGHHELSDGRVASVIWLPSGQTTVHIIIWISGTTVFETVQEVFRFHAARISEDIFKKLEA